MAGKGSNEAGALIYMRLLSWQGNCNDRKSDHKRAALPLLLATNVSHLKRKVHVPRATRGSGLSCQKPAGLVPGDTHSTCCVANMTERLDTCGLMIADRSILVF